MYGHTSDPSRTRAKHYSNHSRGLIDLKARNIATMIYTFNDKNRTGFISSLVQELSCPLTRHSKAEREASAVRL